MGTDQLTERQSPKQDCLLLYDGECRLCVFTKAKLEQLGVGQAGMGVRFLAYQSKETRGFLGHAYRPGRPETAFLIQPSGMVLQGVEAFLPIIPSLPGGKLMIWVLRLTVVRQLAELVYRMVARHRYQWFGAVKLTG